MKQVPAGLGFELKPGRETVPSGSSSLRQGAEQGGPVPQASAPLEASLRRAHILGCRSMLFLGEGHRALQVPRIPSSSRGWAGASPPPAPTRLPHQSKKRDL